MLGIMLIISIMVTMTINKRISPSAISEQSTLINTSKGDRESIKIHHWEDATDNG